MVCMSEQDEQSSWNSSTRGEQAWKEDVERVASRNAEARKAGKKQREAYEQRREDARRAAAAGAEPHFFLFFFPPDLQWSKN
jgi:hypothetical protein